MFYAIVVSLLAFLFIGILLVSELTYYFKVVRTSISSIRMNHFTYSYEHATFIQTQDTVDKMMVDGTRNRVVLINFDVEFPR